MEEARSTRVYGRAARIRALMEALEHGSLPDMAIDMLYTLLMTFL